jgi:periplasmic copper chaperone A
MMRSFNRSTIAAVMLAAAAAWHGEGANAHDYKLGQIAIGHIHTPPVADPDEGAAVVVPLFNRGSEPASLVAVHTAVAERARFREVEGNETRWLERIDLPPGRPVALAAWRAHIWLDGLKGPLEKGDRFPLTLDFGPAGAIEVEVYVEAEAKH